MPVGDWPPHLAKVADAKPLLRLPAWLGWLLAQRLADIERGNIQAAQNWPLCAARSSAFVAVSLSGPRRNGLRGSRHGCDGVPGGALTFDRAPFMVRYSTPFALELYVPLVNNSAAARAASP